MSESTDPQLPVVSLHTQDGRSLPCRMERDEALDRPEGDPRGPMVYWKAIPSEPVELGTFEVEVIFCPPRHGFNVEVPKAGPGLSRLVTGE